MDMQSASKGEISRVRIPGSYVPSVKATRSVGLPAAYAVPRNFAGVLDVLARHRFVPGPVESAATEIYRIDSLIPAHDEETPAMPVCKPEPVTVSPDDYILFPTRQTGGNLLALLLEPESQFGPHRMPELAAALQPGMKYPVLRVAEQ